MRNVLLCTLLGGLGLVAPAQASVIFDDFNTNVGHFNLAITFSGNNTNIATAGNSAARTTADSIEGSGSMKMTIAVTTAGSTSRIRFLSGGGTPANNADKTFTISAGTDGYIGFYAKTSVANWTAALAIDDADASFTEGKPLTLNADGNWHLYEWNLDDSSKWEAVAGIGGNATLANGSATIDSIVFRNTAGQNGDILFDFLAKSDSGSIAALLPEPASLSLLALAATPLLRRRRA